MSVVIFVVFAVPTVFGFQNFVQWGGMYDDRWCTVIAYEKNPHEDPSARSESRVPGSDVMRVYSATMHNRTSCLAIARKSCGMNAKDGWTATWVEPEFRRVRYMGDVNICALDLPSLDSWFSDAQ